MNLAKSIFISTYLSLLFAGVARAVWALFLSMPALPWFWVLLALAPALGFFGWVFLCNVARTGRMSLLMWVPGLMALMGAVITATLFAESAFWIGGVGLVGALVYIRWYSRFADRDSQILKVGNTLPPLMLTDSNGLEIQTSQLQGPLLLMFYRGNWCPLCMAQIREVAAQYQTLEQRGVQVLAISPQPAAHSAELTRRFQVNMQFLVDQNNQVARQLGILAENGLPMGLQALGYDSDTVMPTVIITDAQRTILFADLTDNYRIRPEPETFLRVLEQAGIA